ncbi:Abi-alpha family protein [Tsukamurella pseudospumae]|uniref:DUF4393 domain-containing protein n=1 Tax=Tsukamurella pseudospumae TaxID=239498 RepID=A0A138A7I7_9ACTN|nr:Abi-alpha family protein [Tsukamurella pseudospumae]KXP06401.1 hypothetical protein AXK60_09900 [Tsukamurella pseudospumae]
MSDKGKKHKKSPTDGSPSQDDAARGDSPRPRGGLGGIPLFGQLAEGLTAPLEQITGATLSDAVGKLSDTALPIVEPVLEPATTMATAAVAPLQQGAEALGLGDITGLVDGGLLGGLGSARRSSPAGLRKRGNALIRLSQRPNKGLEDHHPSFGHIVDQLLPDEARILRFMGKAGTQPLIDVRTKTLFMIGSELLLGDLSMVAEMSGCERPEQDRSYFANLHRLGLLEMSDEPVDDYRRYALLEVQPAAVHAIESVKKAHTIFRSIRITAFGSQFIGMAFDLDEYNAGGWADDGRRDKYLGKRGPHGRKLTGPGNGTRSQELADAG